MLENWTNINRSNLSCYSLDEKYHKKTQESRGMLTEKKQHVEKPYQPHKFTT